MSRKSVFCLLSVITIAVLLVSSNSLEVHCIRQATAKTWIVDSNGSGDFRTIQEAVNASSDGDTIFVKNGTYYEHVNLGVNAYTSTLSIVGESLDVIVDGNGTGTVFWGTENSGPDAQQNLYLNFANLTVRNADIGIQLQGQIKFGPFQTINITNVRVENCKSGILGDYLNGAVEDNFFLDNGFAVSLPNFGGTFVNNTIMFSKTGFLYSDDFSNLPLNLTNNHILCNEIGVQIEGASPKILRDNLFEYNDLAISMGWVGDLLTYHNNFINNTQNVYVSYLNGQGYWDSGYPTGGNYWSDYTGIDVDSGQYQNLTGSDGIGDTPYVIDLNNKDNFPFMNPLSISIPPLPVMQYHPFPRFTHSPTAPSIYGTITFNASTSIDIDGRIVSYMFDFGDGTNSTSTQPIFTHAYSSLGDYNVTLLVIDNDGLNSNTTKTISIGKIISTISLSASATVLTIGDSVSLNWSLYPTIAFSNVALYWRLSGQNWTMLTNVTSPSVNTGTLWSGSFLWTPPQPGDYQAKANWTGDEYTAPAESSIIDVECVKVGTSISIFTTAESRLVGFYVNISGYLLDQYGKGIQEETVVLSYNFAGTNAWTPITSDNTKTDGSYAVTWFPTATGSFTIKAEWAGNDTYSQSHNDVTLASLPYNNQYVFTVQSNGAVSDMSFDQQKRELSFSATGQEGTIDQMEVTVAKSLVSDVGALKVRIDGVESNFTISDFGDSWMIGFSYYHSTHEVEIYLGAASTNNPFLTNLILYVIIAIGIGVIASILIIRKRRQK